MRIQRPLIANGRSVVQDDAEAVRWYRMAAEQGNAAAQANLSGLCAKGRHWFSPGTADPTTVQAEAFGVWREETCLRNAAFPERRGNQAGGIWLNR
jgi:TPR repeat protein